MQNRRKFIIQLGVSGAALLSGSSMAQEAMLKETDTQAVAIDYKEDGAKVDKKKYPNYAPDQRCSSCSLYQEKSGDIRGACLIVTDRQVAGKGWCNAWTNMA